MYKPHPLTSILQQLQASVFGSVCDSATSGEDDGYRALTAIGLLSAIQTLVKAAVENQPVRAADAGVGEGAVRGVLESVLMRGCW